MFRLTKPSDSKRRLPEAAATLYQLVETFRETSAAQLESYQLLARVLAEQCSVVESLGQETRVEVKEPGEVRARAFRILRIQTPVTTRITDRGTRRRSWRPT